MSDEPLTRQSRRAKAGPAGKKVSRSAAIAAQRDLAAADAGRARAEAQFSYDVLAAHLETELTGFRPGAHCASTPWAIALSALATARSRGSDAVSSGS